jgi:predicted sulfurtransferase
MLMRMAWLGCAAAAWLAAGGSGFATAAPKGVQPEDEAPRITQADFKKLIARHDVIIVDTRNADAYAQSHIPGAILLPLEGQLTWSDEYQKTVVEPLKHATKPVVTYCA